MPAEQVDIKVDCYLSQHGWGAEDILDVFHKGVSSLRTARSISERVARAKKTGQPQLIWLWRDDEKAKAAKDLLEYIKLVNTPRN